MLAWDAVSPELDIEVVEPLHGASEDVFKLRGVRKESVEMLAVLAAAGDRLYAKV